MSPTALNILALATALAGQTPPAFSTSKEAAADPLKFMRGTLAPIRLSTSRGDRPLVRSEEPVFRMGKQGADIVQEGAIFLWKDDVGRPAAAVQVFLIRDAGAPDGLWMHEFISLSPGPLNGDRSAGAAAWNPQAPGVTLTPVPGAPRPAATPAQRDRQMRALAREFQATDNFHEKSWIDLRLLPTPVARYGRAGSSVEDGALFAFVTGTDPEAFLFLEVRTGPAGPQWHYAFAPMTCFELKGSHRGKVVWSAPLRYGARDPSGPYYLLSIPDR